MISQEIRLLIGSFDQAKTDNFVMSVIFIRFKLTKMLCLKEKLPPVTAMGH